MLALVGLIGEAPHAVCVICRGGLPEAKYRLVYDWCMVICTCCSPSHYRFFNQVNKPKPQPFSCMHTWHANRTIPRYYLVPTCIKPIQLILNDLVHA